MKFNPRTLGALVFYGVIYCISLAVMTRSRASDTGEALGVMLIFGLGFSAVAWLATSRMGRPPMTVRAPAPELGMLSVYLAVFAVVFLGWGLSALRVALPSEPVKSVAILASKVVAMVLLPAWLFSRLGYSWKELTGLCRFGRRDWLVLLVMAMLLLGLQITVGRGPKMLAELHRPAWQIVALAPFALAWLVLEAGLTEEFMFRALLQTRAASWLRSEIAGLVLMSLLFGLAHAPGYVLRGAHAMEGMSQAPTVLQAVAYSIAVVSPLGLMFGVLWARTRNFWLVVLLHGWGDLLPNLAPFVKTWLPG